MADRELITVEVVYAKPHEQRLLRLEVRRGTTLIDAVKASGILEVFPEIDVDTATFGIFGRVVKNRLHVVHHFDRIEIYRPLENDPKDLRAARARAQKASRKKG